MIDISGKIQCGRRLWLEGQPLDIVIGCPRLISAGGMMRRKRRIRITMDKKDHKRLNHGESSMGMQLQAFNRIVPAMVLYALGCPS
jgi:hypothetical protein